MAKKIETKEINPEEVASAEEPKMNEYTITLTVELTKVVSGPAEVGDTTAEIKKAFPGIVQEYLDRIFDQVLISDLKVFKTVDNNE